MSDRVYETNRGIGKRLQFMGLAAQYFYMLATGVIMILLITVVLSLLGVSWYLVMLFFFGTGTLLVFVLSKLNQAFGVSGMERFFARHHRPEGLIRNRKFNQLNHGRSKRNKGKDNW